MMCGVERNRGTKVTAGNLRCEIFKKLTMIKVQSFSVRGLNSQVSISTCKIDRAFARFARKNLTNISSAVARAETGRGAYNFLVVFSEQSYERYG
jgi:hypothetical protein